MIDLLPWLVIAAFIVGISKGGLASAGSLAVPFLAIFMNPVQAAALILPVLLVTDLVAIWLYRTDFSRRNVAILLPAFIFGITLATFLVPYASEAFLLVMTGSVGLWTLWRRWFRPKPDKPAEARVVPGLFWGTLAGITTFITHSGAPPTQAFLLPQNLPKMIFAGTMAISFGIANFTKVPGYHALGYFEDLNWTIAIGLATVGICGTVVGRWLVKTLSDRVFGKVIELLLLALSLILIAKAAQIFFA